MEQSKKTLHEIETALLGLIGSTRSKWMQEFFLIQEVQDNELFLPEHKSFSQWLRAFAQKADVHESVIWNHFKAGKVYARYEERAAQKGVSAISAKDVTIPSESLVLIEKIAGSNDDVADELIDKVLDNQLGRKELQAGYEAAKAVRKETGQKPVRSSRHDEAPEQLSSTSIAAINLVMAISSGNREWLSSLVPKNRSKYINSKYTALPEFAVRTGTSRHARRIDVLVAETLTCEQVGEIHLHGIENKVDRSDLLNDKKVGEYADFVDYLWLCVPVELVEDARKVILPEWGILAYEESGTIGIVKNPSKLPARMREEALVELALKII